MTIHVSSLCEIDLSMIHIGQSCHMVYQYYCQNVPAGVTAVQIAEGWWNHVKASHRALASVTLGNVFVSVKIRELNNAAGDYAEYDIPVAEKVGTRANPGGDLLPPNLATGVRLVVGTRETRPGQKRAPFMFEADQASGANSATWMALVNTWAGVITNTMTLGAPAALTELRPIVVGKDATGFVVRDQFITGFLVNPNTTTQNSRKIGRGI